MTVTAVTGYEPYGTSQIAAIYRHARWALRCARRSAHHLEVLGSMPSELARSWSSEATTSYCAMLAIVARCRVQAREWRARRDDYLARRAARGGT